MYIYRFESKIVFWIFGLLISTIIFSILYYSNFFDSKYQLFPFNFSLVLLILFFFIGFFSNKWPAILYSFFNNKNKFSKDSILRNVQYNNDKTKILIKRFKEIFSNIKFSDKKESLSILRRTVGFSNKSAEEVYNILKQINKRKYQLIFSGILVSILIYLLITNLNFLSFITKTKFYPLAISLLIFLIFFFKGISLSKLPINFYLNLVIINKKAINESKENLVLLNQKLTDLYNDEKKNQQKLKDLVYDLTCKGVLKKEILEILKEQDKLNSKLKLLIDESREEYNITSKKDYNQINYSIKEIVDQYEVLKIIDNDIYNLKQEILEAEKIKETIEKINSDDWEYYKNLKLTSILRRSKDFEDKITDQIFQNIDYKKNVKKDYNLILNDLYQATLPYSKTLTKNKLASILISRGYSYEVVDDLINLFEKNNIDLDKNKSSVQNKIITSINSIYESFRD